MFNKDRFLEFALSKFTKFGSKRFTLDDLAHELGISKKTIYENFKGKEEIIQESLVALLNKLRYQINECVEKEKSDPIRAVIAIYRIGLDTFKSFSPTFLRSLKKYYPNVYRLFNDFRENDVSVLVKDLLLNGQGKGQIRKDVDIDLTYELYYNRMEYIVHAENKNFYEQFTPEELLNHIIINNLRGIATKEYLNKNDSIFLL
ncbi:TetR/AcrR family transcriptional regulator [Zobellia galactanivorans]|uniref:TetR/AcrR family transcriptional regulator n=1 Tax=Zobellia galactanivorans (strain DSM 12802 / CCUG 47099 / CIP 106680 / NCIMB 13871 / Dsij) TaxID=63186 RepID=UPI001C0662C5|nr:TetR/AcrR family transcriptional regulator [Zobellia galactanivorans]MBU3027965.1 TetR/AcrR family transcriptional regulator [Zobellia galactanivorans]MDO6808244.1 TetR/AcrR family transcriptional regulator [Zobellia galactanivorans]